MTSCRENERPPPRRCCPEVVDALGGQTLVESPYFEKLERLYLGLLKLSQAQQEALRQRFGERVAF